VVNNFRGTESRAKQTVILDAGWRMSLRGVCRTTKQSLILEAGYQIPDA